MLKETRFDSIDSSPRLNEPSQSRNVYNDKIHYNFHDNSSSEFVQLKDKADELKKRIYFLQKVKRDLIVKRMKYIDNKRHFELMVNDINKYNAITDNCKSTMLELTHQVNELKNDFKRIYKLNQ